MQPWETTLVILLVVAGGGWLMRAMSGGRRDESAGEPVPQHVTDDSIDEVLEEASRNASEIVAIDADGWAFVPRDHAVLIVPPRETDLVVPEGSGTGPQLDWSRAQPMSPGDLVGARVRRGAPWRLEALGRDREYQWWGFETEGAARAAHALVAQRIVAAPLDDDGEEVVFGDAEFDAARQEFERTERELAIEGADEDESDGR